MADELARSGWITDLTPGLRIEAAGSRVAGYLEYRLHELRYSSDSALDRARTSSSRASPSTR
ncbi:MAG: hypothetical protein IPJ28_11080 [Betaproteobacteria bacterium]|nr:hypothetical protein [Betaproteobacteria bacterium]